MTTYILLVIICIISVEFFNFTKFFGRLDTILQITRKVFNILTSKKISDHWKEKIILNYALKLMTLSLQILLIILFIVFIFFIADLFLDDFLINIFSLQVIIISFLFIMGYLRLKKFI